MKIEFKKLTKLYKKYKVSCQKFPKLFNNFIMKVKLIMNKNVYMISKR